ncbi:MAG: hypothetical protein LC753_18875, partial [Acidobacteria bacterium]|nr:hypothetical protein [Acidobacteriota bacterium]
MFSTIAHGITRPWHGVLLLTAVVLGAGFPIPAAAQSSERLKVAEDDPFERRGWYLELGGHAAFETWNYNISHEEMYAVVSGMTYGIRQGVAITATAPLYYVSQRGVDAYLLGVTVGLRGRVYHRSRVSAFVEFDVGVSEADTYVPPRGTRFNYLALGAAGATIRCRPGVH